MEENLNVRFYLCSRKFLNSQKKKKKAACYRIFVFSLMRRQMTFIKHIPQLLLVTLLLLMIPKSKYGIFFSPFFFFSLLFLLLLLLLLQWTVMTLCLKT